MVRTALLTLWFLALSAPAALAAPGHDGGKAVGPTNDKVVTNAGFILIAGFPVLICSCRCCRSRSKPQGPPPRGRQGPPRPG